MGYKRPALESDFVRKALDVELRELSKRPDDVQRLLEFARNEVAANPLKLGARLNMIFGGRAPTAFLSLLIRRFYDEGRYSDIPTTELAGVNYSCPTDVVPHLRKLVLANPLAPRAVGAQLRHGRVTLVVHSPHLVLATSPEVVVDQDAFDHEVAEANAPTKAHINEAPVTVDYFATASTRFSAFRKVGFDVDGAA
jgi:hypothetical protein